MSVVINEFEVLPESPASAPASSPAADSGPAQAPSAPEVERVIVHLAERAERVRAH